MIFNSMSVKCFQNVGRSFFQYARGNKDAHFCSAFAFSAFCSLGVGFYPLSFVMFVWVDARPRLWASIQRRRSRCRFFILTSEWPVLSEVQFVYICKYDPWPVKLVAVAVRLKAKLLLDVPRRLSQGHLMFRLWLPGCSAQLWRLRRSSFL